MAKPMFTQGQKFSLERLGLGPSQITELERTLTLATAFATAETPPMLDVRDVLADSRAALHAAMHATITLMHPNTSAPREASCRAIDADGDAEHEGGAVMDAFDALVEAGRVLDKALDALPDEQRRERTSVRMFQRIDKALLDGFIDDAGIGIEGLPSKPYRRIEPSRNGVYKKVVRIYYDAMGLPEVNPDRAIRNFIAWRASVERPVAKTKNTKAAGGKSVRAAA